MDHLGTYEKIERNDVEALFVEEILNFGSPDYLGIFFDIILMYWL